MFDFKSWLLASYWLASNYHSGQTSIGYRVLSQAGALLRRWYGINRPMDYIADVFRHYGTDEYDSVQKYIVLGQASAQSKF